MGKSSQKWLKWKSSQVIYWLDWLDLEIFHWLATWLDLIQEIFDSVIDLTWIDISFWLDLTCDFRKKWKSRNQTILILFVLFFVSFDLLIIIYLIRPHQEREYSILSLAITKTNCQQDSNSWVVYSTILIILTSNYSIYIMC